MPYKEIRSKIYIVIDKDIFMIDHCVKSLLEETLERTLIKLDMPLGDRIYGEDLDFEAEIEDLVYPIKSNSNVLDKIFGASESQMNYGEQPNLRRRSSIYNGLGFEYQIIVSKKEKISCNKKSLNSIIINRDFGERGCEEFTLYYLNGFIFPENIRDRDFKSQYNNRFYESQSKGILSFDILRDFKIDIINLQRFSGKSNESYLPIAGIVDEIVEKFNGKIFNDSSARELSSYLRELKNAV